MGERAREETVMGKTGELEDRVGRYAAARAYSACAMSGQCCTTLETVNEEEQAMVRTPLRRKGGEVGAGEEG